MFGLTEVVMLLLVYYLVVISIFSIAMLGLIVYSIFLGNRVGLHTLRDGSYWVSCLFSAAAHIVLIVYLESFMPLVRAIGIAQMIGISFVFMYASTPWVR